MKTRNTCVWQGLGIAAALAALSALNLAAQPATVEPVQPVAAAEPATLEPPDTNSPVEAAAEGETDASQSRGSSQERVSVGSSTLVAAGETVREAVSVFGNSKVDGTVERDMVTVFGSAKVNGSVGHDMVTVFGDAEVSGAVEHDLIVVFGSLKLGPDAKVGNDCIAVFGEIDRAAGATVGGSPMEIMPWFSGLSKYLLSGPLLGRPLPPTSGLAWIFVGLHFLLYLLIALMLPKQVDSCVRQIRQKPLQSFGVGILGMILLAPLFFILVATGVGAILVPFLVLAELALSYLGKTASLECFGIQALRRSSAESNTSPLLTFFVGFVVVTLLYMVPILGGLLWLALRPLALGAALLALFALWRRNGGSPAQTAPPIPVYTAPPPAGGAEPGYTSGFAAGAGYNASPTEAYTQPSAASALSPPADAAMMPRAGFWIRLAATALDFILLFWLIPISGRFFLLCWLAYHVAMWKWKGTTIGGIVCSLRVVRLDGQPADFGVVLVRALASVFSGVALFLGFFWVGWTRERQSWHDKIAGTVIVRTPKGVSLV